ncbi:MAG TPA: acetylxylan esterase [Verrucomicrobiota bacterium]|nr:acetylxylan esterase [Verrucomicrobiota bacterium]HNT15491.1 acetylxylan esterase [Verrucomicrobiota bacterium]
MISQTAMRHAEFRPIMHAQRLVQSCGVREPPGPTPSHAGTNRRARKSLPHLRIASLLSGLLVLWPGGGHAGGPEIRTLDTPRFFTPPTSRADWEARAADIRAQVLVSCGLWLPPEKTPLHAQILGRIEHEDYTVERVTFQSWPGCYVGGNLYRPRAQGPGPFPAVLNPHGHWPDGRLTDVPAVSVPGRCINLAKQGIIAFAYDMVGYNDTSFANYPRAGQPGAAFDDRHRFFGTNALCQLWNISLMGLQTWNSIRALDFLESLPDVDQSRLGCTGASAGGTQTFILGAIEERLTVQAPVCMVSHFMQGSCLCENAPGLRVKYSNLDIAAAAAPRPQILIAATGDWTKDLLAVEGPAIASVYDLLGAGERLRYLQFDSGHNYNQSSREAVYAWLNRWLWDGPDTNAPAEKPYVREPDRQLRVWPDDQLPADAITDQQLMVYLKTRQQNRLAALRPKQSRDFDAYRSRMQPLWRHTLQVEWPIPEMQLHLAPVRAGNGWSAMEFRIRAGNEAGTVTAIRFQPAETRRRSARANRIIVLAHEDGAQRYCNAAQEPQGLAAALLQAGCAVVVPTQFSPVPTANPFKNFYTTYNRTRLQQRVGDLLAVCDSVRKLFPSGQSAPRVILCGAGRAGWWSLLAAPGAQAVVADLGGLSTEEESAWLDDDLFCPGLLSLGGFETAALLAAPHPLVIHNAGTQFDASHLQRGYKVLRATRHLLVRKAAATDEAIQEWLTHL